MGGFEKKNPNENFFLSSESQDWGRCGGGNVEEASPLGKTCWRMRGGRERGRFTIPSTQGSNKGQELGKRGTVYGRKGGREGEMRVQRLPVGEGFCSLVDAKQRHTSLPKKKKKGVRDKSDKGGTSISELKKKSVSRNTANQD